MSSFTFILLACACATTSTMMLGQAHYPAGSWECPFGDGAVRSRVLHTDSLSTSTLLCIRGEVPPHLHAYHTEHVQVLAGEALMLLGDSVFNIGPGSFIAIPCGTRHAVRVSGTAPLRLISVQAPQHDGTDRIPVDAGALWAPP